jgi:hypothetical protein
MSLTRFRFIALALLWTACASSNPKETHSPSERSSSRSKPATREEGKSRGRPKAHIDFNRLPDLPQYPCGPAQFDAATGGNLDPAVIQEHLRARFSKLKRCYEVGLGKNPGLGGKVTVRFVIERDGRVGKAVPICTSMPDPAVVACIVGEYGQMRFPRPEAGVVTVVYPVTFSPGN